MIHHGGISTVARALAARTPQVILPVNLDRPDSDAARLHKHRLAEWLPVGQWAADRVAEMLARCSTCGSIRPRRSTRRRPRGRRRG